MKIRLLLCLCFFGGCFDFDATEEDNTAAIPVTMLRSDLRNSVISQGPLPLRKPGKIYIFHNYLFVVELYAGVHVIDNSTPTIPQHISFIAIPGCVDIAAKDNTLYADNATDLVAIDITDPTRASVTARFEKVFPPLPPPDGMTTITRMPDLSKEVIIRWKDTVIR